MSAEAFSSTFAIESTLKASQWISRLSRPEVNTFIAVAYAPGTSLEKQTIDAGDWVGSATLLGPRTKVEFDLPKSGGPEIGGDEAERKWQMCAVYNNPEHRGKGLAKMLINGAVDFATKEAGVGRRSRVRIIIHHDNLVCSIRMISSVVCVPLRSVTDWCFRQSRNCMMGLDSWMLGMLL